MTGTVLLPDEEQEFQNWYADWAAKAGIDPNPDNPEHRYDYRGAWKAGAEPQIDPTDNRYHWPSQFKADDHPNRVVNGVDTKTGKPVTSPTPPSQKPQAGPSREEVPRLSGGDLIPLSEYLKTRLKPRAVGSPSGQVTPVEDIVRGGARALIPRLRGPVEFPAGDRMAPKTMTDAQPVATQLRDKVEEAGPAFATTPMNVARPQEVTTPREASTADEVDRIMKLLDDLSPDAAHG